MSVLSCEFPLPARIACVKYDNRATDLTKEVSGSALASAACCSAGTSWLIRCVRTMLQGMRKGIDDSAAFVLFLSEGVLLRPFCESLRSRG